MKYDSICNQFGLSVLCVRQHIHCLFVIDEGLLALREIICTLMTSVMMATLMTSIQMIFTNSRSQFTISVLSDPKSSSSTARLSILLYNTM